MLAGLLEDERTKCMEDSGWRVQENVRARVCVLSNYRDREREIEIDR